MVQGAEHKAGAAQCNCVYLGGSAQVGMQCKGGGGNPCTTVEVASVQCADWERVTPAGAVHAACDPPLVCPEGHAALSHVEVKWPCARAENDICKMI